VRVGPYASREAAEKARQQLQRLQLDGKVMPR
jgi:cell division septation protein DedD